MMRALCILGATGSVGKAALEVARQFPRHFRVRALAAKKSHAAMAALCREFTPAFAALTDDTAAARLKETLHQDGAGDVAVGGGEESLNDAVEYGDTIVAAMSGVDGVAPLLAAAKKGKRILIANKEALIFAGELLTKAVRDGGGELLPIDSEHGALFDLLAANRPYRKLWLTASGGGARDVPLDELETLSPSRALRHPTWSMGDKITVDSATMMNKALEIMEAAVLFSCPAQKIGVVIHRQSLVHALVEYPDGTMTAHLSRPDMRLPIARMLFWPGAGAGESPPPDWRTLSSLEFQTSEDARYPCLGLAYRALAAGGAAAAMLSAANEVAVRRFLGEEIKFTDIARINDFVLRQGGEHAADSVEEIRRADGIARDLAREWAP